MKKFLSLLMLFMITLTYLSTVHAMDYQLEQVVILSRHNLRSSLKAGSSRGLLTARGGEMETLMGQYFEARLQEQGLFSKNAQPATDEVRFYANSYQRTIATAKYFSAGAFPIANINIEYHRALNQRDKIFLPPTDAGLLQKISKEGNSKKLLSDYRKAFATVERISGKKFNSEDSSMCLRDGVVEWNLKGSAQELRLESDAILMDYYDEKVSHSDEEMRDVAMIASLLINTNFDRPIGAKVFAAPMLSVLSDELNTNGRKFSFICGHDCNLATVLAAMNVEKYELPNTVEMFVPIASKLVIEKLKGSDGNEYARLSLMYPSTKQIRNREMINLDNPPMEVPLKFKGIQAVDDTSTYKLSDILKIMSEGQIIDGRRAA